MLLPGSAFFERHRQQTGPLQPFADRPGHHIEVDVELVGRCLQALLVEVGAVVAGQQGLIAPGPMGQAIGQRHPVGQQRLSQLWLVVESCTADTMSSGSFQRAVGYGCWW